MDQDAIADQIIEDHTVYAAGAGSIPVPLADVAAVAAIQIDLVRALARVYEVPFDVATGKAVVASLTGASAARLGASAVKALPGVGSIGGNFYGPDEWVDVDDLVRLVAVVIDTTRNWSALAG